jgi:hypothetical protein
MPQYDRLERHVLEAHLNEDPVAFGFGPAGDDAFNSSDDSVLAYHRPGSIRSGGLPLLIR